jgi:cytochrome c peroxidase
VVDFYNGGGGETQNKSPLLKPLNLSRPKKDLVAFLEALSMDKPLLHDEPKLPGDYQPLAAARK